MIDRELLTLAERAAARAHSPYSRVCVGAALRAPDGRVFTGCNVENASYGLTICAERVAATKAISEGVSTFVAAAVWSSTPRPFTPCGACRQFLSEFARELPISLGCAGGAEEEAELSALLPRAFHFER
ncbi:MAG: cytidine deaminase [Planctomycetes bacterium]|nr:cytidine deaminase [Planctomycetota bacterium]